MSISKWLPWMIPCGVTDRCIGTLFVRFSMQSGALLPESSTPGAAREG